jgi:hypothetical protein
MMENDLEWASPHVLFESLCAVAATGDLDAAEQAALQEHLAGCAPCRERLRETRWLETQLRLARAHQKPERHLPQGMRERFLARAQEEGIPLRAPQAIEFPPLGMATALLIVLLLAAAALKAGPFTDTVTVTDQSEAPSGLPSNVSSDIPGPGLQPPLAARALVKRASQPRHQVSMGKAALQSSATFRGREFHFMLSPRSAAQAAVLPTLDIQVPTPRLILDADSEIFRHVAPTLLAYGRGSIDSNPSSLESNLVPGPGGGRSFHLSKNDLASSGFRWLQIPGGRPQ